MIFDLFTLFLWKKNKKIYIKACYNYILCFSIYSSLFVGRRVKKYILRFAIIMYYDFGFIHSLFIKRKVKKSKKIGV